MGNNLRPRARLSGRDAPLLLPIAAFYLALAWPVLRWLWTLIR